MSFDKISFKLENLLSQINNEIPLTSLTLPLYEKNKKSNNINNIINYEKFNIKETTSGEESVSIFFTQGNQTIYISIFGPKEMRIREKANGQYDKLELYLKFSTEISPNLLEKINKKIKKFAKDMILRASYPKCQITININIFNTSTDINDYAFIPIICNGIMSALCLSGINIKMFCLGKGIIQNNEKYMIFLEMNDDKEENNKLYDFESDNQINVEELEKLIKECKISLNNMNKNLKNYIYKKLLNN